MAVNSRRLGVAFLLAMKKTIALLLITIFLSGCASFLKPASINEESISVEKEDFLKYGYADGYIKGMQDCRSDVKLCGKCPNWDGWIRDISGRPPAGLYVELDYYSGSAIYNKAYEEGYLDAYKNCRREISYKCPNCLDKLFEKSPFKAKEYHYLQIK